MGIKVNTNNDVLDALTIQLNELKVSQEMTKYKSENPNSSQEQLDEKEREFRILYNLEQE